MDRLAVPGDPRPEITMSESTNEEVGRQFGFSRRDFQRIRELIYARAGITLADNKRDMVYNRIVKRVRHFGLKDFASYLDLLQSSDEQPEWEHFTNALTTNLTAFFRESHHFEILHDYLQGLRGRSSITMWCSAASTGEEPYSMAMAAVEAFGSFHPPVRILATDVDTQVLEQARKGVYTMDRLDKMDPERVRRFFLKGKGEMRGHCKVVPELQNLISFRPLNLLQQQWPVRGPFEVIFCRNVMIYFDKDTQYQILKKFMPVLRPDGLLFAGHSESFMHASDLFRTTGRTVYRRNDPVALAARNVDGAAA